MKDSLYLRTAVRAAKKAAQIHRRYFNKESFVRAKSSHYNLVTRADIEAERAIVEIIRNKFPEHNFIGEENEYAKTPSAFSWIIDPLDGTNNFAHGLPVFSVSIALAEQGELLAGVVYDPLRDELFTAEKGRGAFLNSRTISVSANSELKQSLLFTGFYYDRSLAMKRTLDDIHTFFSRGIMGLRRFGSAALDLCYVACGRADGFWEFMLNPWDFAAGALILREAGGRITDNRGTGLGLEPGYVVASNGLIHEPMLEVLGGRE
jgi:myo-inositol-1(or 4)-monophosphatase